MFGCFLLALAVVTGGRSEYVIAVPGEAAKAAETQEAAEALRTYVKRATGAELPVVGEMEVAGRPAFYLGATERLRRSRGAAPYRDYEHTIAVEGRDILLAGNDENAGFRGPLPYMDREYLGQVLLGDCIGLNTEIKDLSYRRYHGTLKAVLEFLVEEEIVDFLMPGELGLNVYRKSDWSVDGRRWNAGVREADIPFSNCRCYGDLHTTVALGHVDIPYYKTWGGHSLPVAVPRSKYEKTHPEYFIMKDGKRRPDFGPANGGHHCYSNKDVFEIYLKFLKEFYDQGWKWIQVGPTDGQVPCECEECRKMHPDPQERQWLFYRKVAERAKETMPGAKMVLLSYGLSRDAPKSFDTFPDNVMIELCIWSDFEKKFENWAKFRDVPKIAYVYFFGEYQSWGMVPCRSPKYLAKNLRILKENGCRCVFKCGFVEDPGLDAVGGYVFSRLLKDVTLDPAKLVDEFCEKAYGRAAAEPMKKFYRRMHEALDLPRGRSVIDEMKRAPQNPETMFETSFRPELLNYMEGMLATAEGAVVDKYAARLALTRRSFDFLKMRARCYFLAEAYTATQDPALLPVADRLFDEREAMMDAWYDADGKMKPIEGLHWSYLLNFSKAHIVGGGGQMCPHFPQLFRYGKGNVKELMKATRAPEDFRLEYWEAYRELARRMYEGDDFAEVEKAVKEGRYSGDVPGVLRSIRKFREENREFLVDGKRLGKLETLEPDPGVFGWFYRNAKGEVALFVTTVSDHREKIRFRFPGTEGIVEKELGFCRTHVFRK